MNLFTILKKSYLLFVVFFLSALFRITNLDLIEFKADEGINLFLSSRPLFGHGFVPGGTVSSIGITNFPLINYLLFPLTLVSLDPGIISFLIGLINSIAIVAFFIIVKKYYNQAIAIFSSFLIATSPWAILLSRKIWAQDLIFPLFIPLFLSIHKIIIDKNEKYWLLYSLSSLLLIQIHHSVLFFVIPLTLVMILKRIKVNYIYLILGGVIGLIPTIPYIFYQLKTGCFDCNMFLTSGQRVSSEMSPLLFIRPFQLINQGNFFPILRDDIIYFSQNFPFIYSLKQVFYIEYLLIPIGLIIFYKLFKKLNLIIFPIILLPFIYAFFKLEPHIHYFIIISPFLYIFIGVFFYFLIKKSKLTKYASLSFFSLLILISLYYNYAFYQTINDLRNIKGDYGLVFSEKKEMTNREFSDYTKNPNYNEIIIASYVPYGLTRGNIGVSRMLFDPKETEKNLDKLETQVINSPLDRRVQQELIAYYTRRIPSRKTVRMLKAKGLMHPGFQPIFGEVREFYNENNRTTPI